jgi:hypothetical protein
MVVLLLPVVLDNKPTPVAPVTSQIDEKLPLSPNYHRKRKLPLERGLEML